MFGYLKSKMGFGAVQNDAWGDYAGTGIWFDCPGCDTPHEADQPQAFTDLTEAQCTALGESSQEVYEAFDIGQPGGRWEVHPEQARFTFTRADGRQCHARYGVIGSYNQVTHSWLWAWAWPAEWMPAPALGVAQDLLDFGLQKDWQPLTEERLRLNEHEAWHMTKLAAWNAGFPMVYRGPVNECNYHYFAIDRPVWLTA